MVVTNRLFKSPATVGGYEGHVIIIGECIEEKKRKDTGFIATSEWH